MDATLIGSEFFQARMDGSIIDRDHAEYDKYRRIWNGLADRRPTAIVRACSVDDVIKTVRIATKQNALLAVRCGGHSLPG